MKAKLKLKQEMKEAIYGAILLILCTLAFFWVANKQHNAGSQSQDNKFILNATFGRTDGLHEGDMVRISGIKVGEVIQSTLKSDYRVHIKMLLDKDYKIPEDSSISIESESIMGGKFVDISLGGDDNTIGNDGSIVYTQDAMLIEELIDLVISYAKSKQQKKPEDTQPNSTLDMAN